MCVCVSRGSESLRSRLILGLFASELEVLTARGLWEGAASQVDSSGRTFMSRGEQGLLAVALFLLSNSMGANFTFGLFKLEHLSFCEVDAKTLPDLQKRGISPFVYDLLRRTAESVAAW